MPDLPKLLLVGNIFDGAIRRTKPLMILLEITLVAYYVPCIEMILIPILVNIFFISIIVGKVEIYVSKQNKQLPTWFFHENVHTFQTPPF